MAELKAAISTAMPTATHSFIRKLKDKGVLLRCYTQNIDCLEDTLELPVVRLHGSMDKVKCTLCAASYDFTTDYQNQFRNGQPPTCPRCETHDDERVRLGKRQLSMGTLRPNIVLYNEDHPDGETIGKLQTNDLKQKPDLMIVMGTSLKIPALKKFIKQAAKLIHETKKGKVIFINKTSPTKEWDKVFDYEIIEANQKIKTTNKTQTLAKMGNTATKNLPSLKRQLMIGDILHKTKKKRGIKSH